MDTEQIDRLLRAKCRGFAGVFPIDRLPNVKNGPLLMVVNTDPHDRPGEHWVAISINAKNEGYYMDSFGRKAPRVIANYLNSNCTKWDYNDRQLQSAVSRFCGYYCVFFCLYSSVGEKPDKILKCFTRDTGLNDVLAHGFVCKLLK